MALIGISSDPSLNGGTVIDFESVSLQNFNMLSVGIVTFEVRDPSRHGVISDAWSGQYNLAAGKYLTNYDSTGGSQFGQMFIGFSTPVTAFGFKLNYIGSADGIHQMIAYGSGDQILESWLLPVVNGPATINASYFFGIAWATGIRRVLLHIDAHNAFAIDNLTYVSRSIHHVPKPPHEVRIT